MTENQNPPGFTETESGLVVPTQSVQRERRTVLRETYKRIKRLAKELWVGDLVIILACSKCGEVCRTVGELAPTLICKCRERVVR